MLQESEATVLNSNVKITFLVGGTLILPCKSDVRHKGLSTFPSIKQTLGTVPHLLFDLREIYNGHTGGIIMQDIWEICQNAQ